MTAKTTRDPTLTYSLYFPISYSIKVQITRTCTFTINQDCLFCTWCKISLKFVLPHLSAALNKFLNCCFHLLRNCSSTYQCVPPSLTFSQSHEDSWLSIRPYKREGFIQCVGETSPRWAPASAGWIGWAVACCWGLPWSAAPMDCPSAASACQGSSAVPAACSVAAPWSCWSRTPERRGLASRQ